MFPGYRKHERRVENNFAQQHFSFIAIGTYFRNGWPVIMFFVQIIPTHFVDSNSKDGFERWIDARLNDFCQKKLIDKKNSSMPQIKKKNMPKRITPMIKNIVGS